MKKLLFPLPVGIGVVVVSVAHVVLPLVSRGNQLATEKGLVKICGAVDEFPNCEGSEVRNTRSDGPHDEISCQSLVRRLNRPWA